MMTTFTVFPGIMFSFKIGFITKIVQDPKMIIPWTFWTIVMLFNVFDTVGKLLAGTRLGNIDNNLAYILSFSRILIVAVTFLIKYKVYSSDWLNILMIVIFALSNGYCLSIMAIKSTENAQSDKKAAVGIFINIFVIVGITLGSLVALIVDNL